MPLLLALGRQRRRQLDLCVPEDSLLGLQSDVQESQAYTEKPCVKNLKRENIFIFLNTHINVSKKEAMNLREGCNIHGRVGGRKGNGENDLKT